jgi:hypothetical protein
MNNTQILNTVALHPQFWYVFILFGSQNKQNFLHEDHRLL